MQVCKGLGHGSDMLDDEGLQTSTVFGLQVNSSKSIHQCGEDRSLPEGKSVRQLEASTGAEDTAEALPCLIGHL